MSFTLSVKADDNFHCSKIKFVMIENHEHVFHLSIEIVISLGLR